MTSVRFTHASHDKWRCARNHASVALVVGHQWWTTRLHPWEVSSVDASPPRCRGRQSAKHRYLYWRAITTDCSGNDVVLRPLGVDRRLLAVVADLDAPRLGLLGN